MGVLIVDLIFLVLMLVLFVYTAYRWINRD